MGERGEGGSPRSWPAPSDLPRNGTGHLVYPEGYERIWSAYPRTDVGKKAGYRRVRSLARDGVSVDLLVRAAERYAARMRREGREVEKTKHAATYFGPDEWWREELDREDGDRGGGDPISTRRDALAGLYGDEEEIDGD